MNYVEYIKQLYYEVKKEVEYCGTEENFENKRKILTDNYISCVWSISDTLWSIIAESDKKRSWENTLTHLLKRCVLEDIKPKLNRLENGYGFTINEYRNEEQYIIQFLEGYLKCQTPERDISYWCELGELIGVVKFEK